MNAWGVFSLRLSLEVQKLSLRFIWDHFILWFSLEKKVLLSRWLQSPMRFAGYASFRLGTGAAKRLYH